MCVAQRMVWGKCVVKGAPWQIIRTVKRGTDRDRVRRRDRMAGCSVGDVSLVVQAFCSEGTLGGTANGTSDP